jgi:hypothetical protein
MNQHTPFDEHDIEALVREHLLRQEETVDAEHILAGVRAKKAGLSTATPVVPRIGWPRRLGWRLAAAAAVLLTLVWGLQREFSHASPAVLVQQAGEVHAQPKDLCYEILTQLEPVLMDEYRVLPMQRRARLWTRGDRFWMEPSQPARPWAMGRDEQGRVWFASGRQAGFRFEADEVPEPLRVACDLRSMRVKALLRDVLTDFELREEAAPDASHASRVIHATLKPDRSRALCEVTLEIDTQSKVLRRVVLVRKQRESLATITFTLVEQGRLADDTYCLEGHLDADARIYSKDEPPPHRYQMLRRQFELLPP